MNYIQFLFHDLSRPGQKEVVETEAAACLPSNIHDAARFTAGLSLEGQARKEYQKSQEG